MGFVVGAAGFEPAGGHCARFCASALSVRSALSALSEPATVYFCLFLWLGD